MTIAQAPMSRPQERLQKFLSKDLGQVSNLAKDSLVTKLGNGLAMAKKFITEQWKNYQTARKQNALAKGALTAKSSGVKVIKDLIKEQTKGMDKDTAVKIDATVNKYLADKIEQRLTRLVDRLHLGAALDHQVNVQGKSQLDAAASILSKHPVGARFIGHEMQKAVVAAANRLENEVRLVEKTAAGNELIATASVLDREVVDLQALIHQASMELAAKQVKSGELTRDGHSILDDAARVQSAIEKMEAVSKKVRRVAA